MSIQNLSVKTRLFATIGIVGMAMLVVGGFGLRALSNSNGHLVGILDDRLLPLQWITEINAISEQNLILLDNALIAGSGSNADALRTRFRESAIHNDALWKQYSSTSMADGEQELSDAFWQARNRYVTARSRVLDVLASNQIDQARTMRNAELTPAFEAQQKPLDALINLQAKMAEQSRSESLADYTRAKRLSIGAMVIGLILALAFGIALVRSIMNALNQAVHVAENIAKGELDNNISIASTDEFGRLLGALQNMDQMLTKIVGEVRSGATSVGAAARQLATGNDDLSQRTQEQASALEETASSMEEMTATVKQNSDNARQANQLAAGARSQADIGGEVVSRAVSAMAEIDAASKKIAAIIGVIDEIAFQTNLLALNAAVEAARAGEQGRGFAVVASEVRNLAQRSATAAREIKELIGNSVEKVAAGSALVDESGKTLQEIVGSVKRVADIVAEISAASDEQAQGIDQVNTAVTQMDSVTQQNAALVEEATAASKAMEDRAQSLVEQISFFRTKNDASIHGAAANTPARVIPIRKNTTNAARRTPSVAQRQTASTSAPRPQRVANSTGDGSWTEF